MFQHRERIQGVHREEVGAWLALGVKRPPQHLLHPSGEIDSPVACHLHNPTFYVKTPESQETDNISNPCIRQLHQAGFSSKNCFIFDDICRRDRTEDVLLFYTSEILQIHQEFMLSIRRAMGAKVEICFGKNVREKMEKQLELVPLRLWGEFRDVEIFLEMQDQTLLRFVLFVCHPQFFFYHGATSESGLKFRKTQGRKQDVHLAVASKLGGIEAVSNFYEHVHIPHRYGQFDNSSREIVRQLEKNATEQLKMAFPVRYEELELSVKALVDKVEFRNEGTATTTPGNLSLYNLLLGEGGLEEVNQITQTFYTTGFSAF